MATAKKSVRGSKSSVRTGAKAKAPSTTKPVDAKKRVSASSPQGGEAAVSSYLATIDEPKRRGEIERLHALVRETLPALEPNVAAGMIGYGRYRYRYASGREGETSVIAISSRAAYISLYVCAADDRGYVAERYRSKLPKADIGKSCVRFKRLDDLDAGALKAMLREGAKNPMGAV